MKIIFTAIWFVIFVLASIFTYVVVGPLSAILCWVTMLFYPFFHRAETELLNNKSHLTIEEMPILRPVPHPMAGNKGIWNKLLVYLFVPRIWQLVQNWHWIYTEKDGSKVELVLPRGFECDAASIPRPFRSFFNPTGLLLLPALLHDYGFQYNQLWQVDGHGEFIPYGPSATMSDKEQKKFWDELLFDAGMQVNRAWLINIIIWMIRGLSIPTWNAYRKKNSQTTRADLDGPCLCIKNR